MPKAEGPGAVTKEDAGVRMDGDLPNETGVRERDELRANVLQIDPRLSNVSRWFGHHEQSTSV